MNTYSNGISRWVFFVIFFLALVAISIYVIVRFSLYFVADYDWIEKILALLLLLAECFIMIHTIGYAFNVFLVKYHHTLNPVYLPPIKLVTYPPLAIVVASYKEPIHILRDTLICFYNMSYPNKHLYLLDDTRYDLPWDTPKNKEKYRHSVEELCQWLGVNLFRSKWHGAKAGKINDFLAFLSGKQQPGFEFFPYEKKEKTESEKYIIIFDADVNCIPNFAEGLVTLMEQNPKLAFVQTPQYYTNFEMNRVARAAGLQQAIFYEYICEGKSLKGAMFCCGTNVLFRIAALMDVGGFDEASVTEDFATSLKLHGRNWKSLYVNKVLAFGLGPEDLGGFFKQQFRWATGTIGILRLLVVKLFRNMRCYTLSQWWEYFLASTYYLIGWVIFIMFIAPVSYLLFNKPSYFASPEVYFVSYIPYIFITMFMFFWTIIERKYKLRDIFTTLFINVVSFPVFIKASTYALLGWKTTFGITPKGESHVLSFRSLIPQILVALIGIFSVTWGLLRLYYEREPFYAILMNTFWAFFNFATISFFLYYNHAVREEE